MVDDNNKNNTLGLSGEVVLTYREDCERDDTHRTDQFQDRLARIYQALKVKNPTELARSIDRKQSTVWPAIKKHSIPDSWLTTIHRKFGISIQWILDGTGPMRVEESLSDFGVLCGAVYGPGDIRKNTAEAPRPPGQKAAPPTPQDQGEVMLRDDSLDLNQKPTTEPQGFKISDDLHKAARVLESGTAYAIALHLNIQQFDRALDDNVGIQQLKQTMRSMQITVAKESEAMRKEVEELKAQLARLLATGGDDPGQKVA